MANRRAKEARILLADNQSRVGSFDTLRLVFAVLVIFSHSFVLGLGPNASEPLYQLTRGQVTLGSLSVWAFFCISGFLITQSWSRSPSPLKFIHRRVARIYPGYIVAALFGALIVAPLAADPMSSPAISPLDFLMRTILLKEFRSQHVFSHNAFPYALNGSLWSVPYEFWCYIGVMLLGIVWARILRWLVVAVFLALMGWNLLFQSMPGWLPTRGPVVGIFGEPKDWVIVLPFFIAGGMFYLLGGAVLLKRSLLVVAAILLIAASVIPHALAVALPTCGTYLLMGLAYFPRLRHLNLGRFGDFSYGTYLYAFPIQQLIVKFSGGSMAPLKLFLLATPATVLIGVLSWFLVEKHFLARSSQLRHEGKEILAARS